MPGHDRRAVGSAGARKSKARPPSGSSALVESGRRKLQQRVEEPVLGDLRACANVERSPASDRSGNRPVVSARRAELIRTVARKRASCRPRAAHWRRSGSGHVGVRQRAQAVIALLQRRHGFLGRQIAKPPPAALAAGILKIERLPAVLAFEQLHQENPELRRPLQRRLNQNIKAAKPVPRPIYSRILGQLSPVRRQ